MEDLVDGRVADPDDGRPDRGSARDGLVLRGEEVGEVGRRRQRDRIADVQLEPTGRHTVYEQLVVASDGGEKLGQLLGFPAKKSSDRFGRHPHVQERHRQQVVGRDLAWVVETEDVERVPCERLVGVEVRIDKLGSGR